MTEGGGREAVQVECGRGRCRRVHRRVERVERVTAGRPPRGPRSSSGRSHRSQVQLRAVGHPGALGDGARGERDQQVGRREGARAGTIAQPRRRGRPVHEHERGHRRLQAADRSRSASSRSGAHRQHHRGLRPRGSPRRRTCRCSWSRRVTNEILTQSSRYTFRTCLPPAAEVAVPIVQLAQRRGLTKRRRDHRRLRVGSVVQGGARGRRSRALRTSSSTCRSRRFRRPTSRRTCVRWATCR